MEVLVDGAPAPAFHHAGESYVMGQLGHRYVLRVHNRTGRRVEAVVSVDGRDVIDGKTADYRSKRGYLVPAWGSVDIDGWRISAQQAAAFRFAAVADSYASRMGSPRNVGVIGMAVFPERAYTPRPRPWPITPYGGYRERRDYDDAAGGPRPPASSPAPSEEKAKDGGKAESAAPADASGRSQASEPLARRSPARPGLGTEFGEATHSPIREVDFVRASPTRPAAVLGCRYNDRAGLVAMGVDVDGFYSPEEPYLRRTAQPFSVGPYATPPPGWRRW